MQALIRVLCSLLPGLALFATAAAETTVPVPIRNASFEDIGLARENTWSGTPGDPWVHQGSCGAWKLVASGFGPYAREVVQARHGLHVGFCNGPGVIAQQLAVPLEAGVTYTLMVDVGFRADMRFPGYSIQLLVDGEPVATTSRPTPSQGQFVTASAAYTAARDDPRLGKQLGIGLLVGRGSQANFDNVRLIARWTTLRDQVEEYVESRYRQWANRGEFEKHEDYEARVNDRTSAERRAALTAEAAAKLAADNVKWDEASETYDPDREIFVVRVPGLEPFAIAVPIDEAESVDKAFARAQFRNPVYTVGVGDDLVVSSVELAVPATGKTYRLAAQ